jgi:hypothetical protein
MEEELSTKMKEFMTVTDQVKRYRALLNALPDFAILVGLGIAGFFASNLIGHLDFVFRVGIGNTNAFSIIFLVSGISAAFYWVYRKMKKVKVNEWKSVLNEGAPGAIKLLQSMNWENMFNEIRYAKAGFWFYGALRTVSIWLLTFVASTFVAQWLYAIVHWNLSFSVLALFSLALVLTLSTNDFKRSFNQIGKLDALLWELRWFDNDLRRNPYQA